MPQRRRVSLRQMQLLTEFAESHREVALGRFPGGPQAVQVTREVWASLAVQLNSVGEGATKSPDQWRRYWIDFKAKTKAKAADSRRNASATGGGPNRLVPMNDIENRVLALLGPVAVEGLPGVRLPFDMPSVDETEAPAADSAIVAPSTSRTNSQSSVFNHTSSEPLMFVEWLEEDEATSPLGLQLQTSANAQPADTASISSQPEEVSSRQDRLTQRPTRRRRQPRQSNEGVPRWALDIETRRISIEERHTAAIEAMVQLLQDIRDDVRSYLARL